MSAYRVVLDVLIGVGIVGMIGSLGVLIGSVLPLRRYWR